MKAYERLLSYVKVFTPSSEETGTSPSTQYQFDLARLLVQELKELGVKDADVDEHCYVYGHIPATRGYESRQKLGFIAHMDTVSDFCDHPVTPVITPNYDGKDLALGTSGRVLSPKMFPHLSTLKGRTLITSDGTTILGADDKAGVAAITACMAYLKDHPEITHAKICVAFTPDEEIAKGTVNFDIPHFGAEYAYTFDGGEIGTLETENFNAATAMVTIKGVVVHPGLSKGKMVNSIKLASRLIGAFPEEQAPETTEGYEGFIHPNKIEGTVAETSVRILIRDHDKEKFEAKKTLLKDLTRKLAEEESRADISLTIKDSYENMRPYLEKTPKVMEIVREAYRQAGIPISEEPIRGGTDGARLSVRGLPCPNVFTGGLNYHSVYECIPIPSLEAAAEVALSLVKLSAEVKTLK